MRHPIPLATLLMCLVFIGSVFISLMFVSPAKAQMDHTPSAEFDRANALETSQSAIGEMIGSYAFQDTQGRVINLDSLRGKPLIVSLIYTSCFHICPTTTRHLASVVDKARDALGDQSFNIVSIGFDVFRDTPPMMKQFAIQQQIDDEEWLFLSGDQETIEGLARDLGFLFFPSPNGFDHLIQTSIIDQDGRVYGQVYGMNFEVPLLVDPLKRLVFSSDEGATLVSSISDKIRLFCTVYDPAADKYRFDYSIFIGTFIGIASVLALGLQLVKEWRLALRS